MTDIIRFITHSSELVEIDEPLSEAGVLLDAPAFDIDDFDDDDTWGGDDWE